MVASKTPSIFPHSTSTKNIEISSNAFPTSSTSYRYSAYSSSRRNSTGSSEGMEPTSLLKYSATNRHDFQLTKVRNLVASHIFWPVPRHVTHFLTPPSSRYMYDVTYLLNFISLSHYFVTKRETLWRYTLFDPSFITSHCYNDLISSILSHFVSTQLSIP